MNKETLVHTNKNMSKLLSASMITLYICLFVIVYLWVSLMEPTMTVTCQNVGSFKDAQDALKSHPELDKNKDGIACNQLQ